MPRSEGRTLPSKEKLAERRASQGTFDDLDSLTKDATDESDVQNRPNRGDSHLGVDYVALRLTDPLWRRRVERANSFIRDAVDEESRTKFLLDTDLAFHAHVLRRQIRAYVTPVVLLLWLAFSFKEKPLWCVNGSTDYCNDPAYPSWNIDYFSRREAFWIDLACCSIYLVDLALSLIAYGSGYFLADRALLVSLLLTVLAMGDIIYAYNVDYDWFRLGPFLRIAIYVAYSQSIRYEMVVIGKIVPSFAGVFCFGVLFVAIYSWAALLFFENTAQGDQYFSDYGEAMWNLFLALTTSNWPDVMIGAYDQGRVTCVFFVVYIAFGVFFLMNVILAIAFQNYTDQEKTDRKESTQERSENLERAFKELDVENVGYLERDVVVPLLESHTSPENALLMFAMLDNTGDGSVEWEEFADICMVLQLEFERQGDDHLLLRLFPDLKRSRAYLDLVDLLKSQKFDYFIDAVIVLSAVSVFFQLSFMAAGTKAGHDVDLGFALFFVLELLLKVAVLGWPYFWSRTANRVDLLLTLAALAITLFVLIPNTYNDPGAIKFAIFLRMLRFLRFFIAFPSFSMIIGTFFKVLPVVWRLVMVMLCTMYGYTAIGIQIYGGKITKNPESKYFALLTDTAYGHSNYWANNFNDMPSGFMTLFEIMVVSNWDVTVEGHVAVTNKWSRVFFSSFYVFGVLFVLNILVASILEKYMMEYTRSHKSIKIEGEAEVADQHATFDAKYITGTKTGLQGTYKVTVSHQKRGDLDYGAFQDDQETLKKVFKKKPSKIIRTASGTDLTAPDGTEAVASPKASASAEPVPEALAKDKADRDRSSSGGRKYS